MAGDGWPGEVPRDRHPSQVGRIPAAHKSSQEEAPALTPCGSRSLELQYRARWWVLLVFFAITGGLTSYAIDAFDAFSEQGLDNVEGEAYKTGYAFQNTFAPPEPEVVVLLESSRYTVDSPEFVAVYGEVKAGFKKLKTYGFLSWFDYPSQTAMVSDDRHKAIMHVKIFERLTNEQLYSAVPSNLSHPDIKVTIGGELPFANTLDAGVLEDLQRAEVRSLPLVIIFMAFAFRGVVPMIAPLLVAAHTLVWVLAILHAFTMHWRVTTYAIEVATMMGLGLSLDYSLFIVGRFMTERRLRPRPEDIVVVMHKVMSTSGRTIQFSAITVVISLTGSFVFKEFFIGSLALAIICVSLSACIVCSIFLPALLYCLDHHIYRLSTDWIVDKAVALVRGKKSTPRASIDEEERGMWYHITHFTMRYPGIILVCALAFFGALTAVFFTHVSFGANDTNVLPYDSPARVVARVQDEQFSKLGKGQLDVYLKTKEAQGVRSAAFLKELDEFSRKVEQLPGVSDVFSQVRHVGDGNYTLDDYIKLYSNPKGHADITGPLTTPLIITNLDRVSRVRVSLKQGEFDLKSRHTVRALRSLIPATFDPSRLAEHGVTGNGAYYLDVLDDVSRSLTVWAVVMVMSILVLVLLMTASPFLALKAVLTSMLSLGGAFGIIVILFQMGEGKKNILGMVPCGYLDGLQLIFVFTVAFGLGVDYELFVLGSVQEQYYLLGDHREAIAVGLDRAGRYVSMAAILLAMTVGAFVLSGVSLVKMIGLGIAICVVLDATIVRSCVVPTVLVLAGEKVVWWGPQWLKELSMKLGLAEVAFPDHDAAAAAARLPPAGKRHIDHAGAGGVEEMKLELDRHLKSRASHEASSTEDTSVVSRLSFKLWSSKEKVYRRRTMCMLAVLAVAVYIVLVLAGVIIYIATDTFMQQKRLQKQVPIGLPGNLDSLTKLTGTLDSRLKSVESSIDPINTKLEKIRTDETQNLRGVTEHVTNIDGTVDTLSKSVKELTQTTQADVEALKEQLAALQKQMQQPPQPPPPPQPQQGLGAPAAPQAAEAPPAVGVAPVAAEAAAPQPAAAAPVVGGGGA